MKLYSHITVLSRFRRISEISEFWFLGIGLNRKTRKLWKISICGFTKFKYIFFDHYFNFLSAETKINKRVLNLINLDRLEAFKRHKYHTWIAMWLDHFENDVIWATFQLFLKLHFHITVLWRFCRISEFSFLGIGLKMKTRESRKISIFGSAKFKCTWIYFSISF